MNKKGFTLMEILVVVIILAVISLITFPAVKSIILKNKEKTFKEAIEGVIRSTELYISANAVSEFPSSQNYKKPYNTTEIKMEKNNFTGGNIEYKNGVIRVINMTDGDFCANGTKEELQITKGSFLCSSVL